MKTKETLRIELEILNGRLAPAAFKVKVLSKKLFLVII